MKISILGSHITQFGELWDKSLVDLVKEAVFGAIQNSTIDAEAIEAVFVANKAASNFENQMHLGAMVSQMFAHFPPGVRVEAACASGGVALLLAEQALLSGQYKTVLVVGVEKMTDVSAGETTEILSAAADVTTELGSTFPGLYALFADRYMAELGLTREQLSAVAAKNHKHALDNPQAQYRREISIDQVSTSALVADPLRLLDCSPITDGAAAVVLTSKQVDGKPEILAAAQAQDSLDLAGRESLLGLAATQKAAAKALAAANLTPDKIQVAEVHDCFTIAEIMAIEDLGFFERGKGGAATLEGKTTKTATNSNNSQKQQIVINPSGGLKACGHPVGATGVKQVAYLAQQLQNDVYATALSHNIGGSGATAVVHILQKIPK